MQSPTLVETPAYPCRWPFSHHGGKEKMHDEKKDAGVVCEVRFTRKSKITEECWGPLYQNRGERKHAPTNFTKCGGAGGRRRAGINKSKLQSSHLGVSQQHEATFSFHLGSPRRRRHGGSCSALSPSLFCFLAISTSSPFGTMLCSSARECRDLIIWISDPPTNGVGAMHLSIS